MTRRSCSAGSVTGDASLRGPLLHISSNASFVTLDVPASREGVRRKGPLGMRPSYDDHEEGWQIALQAGLGVATFRPFRAASAAEKIAMIIDFIEFCTACHAEGRALWRRRGLLGLGWANDTKARLVCTARLRGCRKPPTTSSRA